MLYHFPASHKLVIFLPFPALRGYVPCNDTVVWVKAKIQSTIVIGIQVGFHCKTRHRLSVFEMSPPTADSRSALFTVGLLALVSEMELLWLSGRALGRAPLLV